MKTYTDAERYQALRSFTVLLHNNPEKAEEISSRKDTRMEELDAGKDGLVDGAAFDKICDELCQLMQAENQQPAE
jgi:hypothetical protein